MSEGLLQVLIFAPIVICIAVLFCFRGKGPSVVEDSRDNH